MINEIASNKPKQYKFLTFIAMFFMTLLLSGTVLGYKIVSFGPILIPGSTIIYPMSYFLGALVTEVYGYKTTRQLIWFAVICGYCYAFFVAAVLELPSPAFWEKEQAYIQIFGDLLRFTTGGSIGMVISELLNSYMLSKWKILARGKYFWLRAFSSTSLGEAAHVILMGFFNFYGVVPTAKLLQLMLSMYSYRIAYGLIAIWPTIFLAIFLKAKEGIDVYDEDTNFNPFSLRLSDNSAQGLSKNSSKDSKHEQDIQLQ